MTQILVIDDDVSVRRLLCIVLERQGYGVITAENGAQGLQAYKAAPTDLVITDLEMPVMDGLQLILALRRAFPMAKIIAISGNPHALTQAQTLTPHTFAKPFELQQMLAAVQTLVAAPEVP